MKNFIEEYSHTRIAIGCYIPSKRTPQYALLRQRVSPHQSQQANKPNESGGANLLTSPRFELFCPTNPTDAELHQAREGAAKDDWHFPFKDGHRHQRPAHDGLVRVLPARANTANSISLAPPIPHLRPLSLTHRPNHQHNPYNYNHNHQLHRNATHSSQPRHSRQSRWRRKRRVRRGSSATHDPTGPTASSSSAYCYCCYSYSCPYCCCCCCCCYYCYCYCPCHSSRDGRDSASTTHGDGHRAVASDRHPPAAVDWASTPLSIQPRGTCDGDGGARAVRTRTPPHTLGLFAGSGGAP